jgi:hypothetical protein
MEDGIFKSDYTVLEDGCTVGTGALVHYDVTMGQGSQLLPDSFLVKGESVPAHALGRQPGSRHVTLRPGATKKPGPVAEQCDAPRA